MLTLGENRAVRIQIFGTVWCTGAPLATAFVNGDHFVSCLQSTLAQGDK